MVYMKKYNSHSGTLTAEPFWKRSIPKNPTVLTVEWLFPLFPGNAKSGVTFFVCEHTWGNLVIPDRGLGIRVYNLLFEVFLIFECASTQRAIWCESRLGIRKWCLGLKLFLVLHLRTHRARSRDSELGVRVWRRGGGLASRLRKMYGERLGDGVEYHLMKPTPRR